jgi:hypothetical protein
MISVKFPLPDHRAIPGNAQADVLVNATSVYPQIEMTLPPEVVRINVRYERFN